MGRAVGGIWLMMVGGLPEDAHEGSARGERRP